MNQLKTSVFDLDQNLLHTKTTIYIERYIPMSNDQWEKIGLTEQEFKCLNENPKRRWVENNIHESHIEFSDNGPRGHKALAEDILTAISDKESHGPSLSKFKETVLHANPYAIITGREHNIQTLMKAFQTILHELFSHNEKKQIIEAILESNHFGKPYKRNALDVYAEQNHYYPVQSNDFKLLLGGSRDPELISIEDKKCTAMKFFLDSLQERFGSNHEIISVGFSDDILKNIENMKLFFEKLSKDPSYNSFHFVVYDCQDPKHIKKIKITEKEKRKK